MSAQFTLPLQVVIPGQLIASSLWNNEWANLNVNFIPAGMDSYSDTDPQMQLQTAPYPGSVTSHAANLGGEIERIRYQISAIIGKTYWYQPPSNTLDSGGFTPIGGCIDYPKATPPNANYHLADGTAINRTVYSSLFALVGTMFGVGDGTTTFNLPDYRDRMSIGAGNLYAAASNGGAVTGTASHSHTVNSHTHNLAGHIHELSNQINSGFSINNTSVVGSTTAVGSVMRIYDVGGGGTIKQQLNTTAGPDVNTSGATAPSTDTQAPTVQVLNPYLSMYKLIRIL